MGVRGSAFAFSHFVPECETGRPGFTPHGLRNQRFANHPPSLLRTLTISQIAPCTVRLTTATGSFMGNMAVLHNVRRYRTIASLCRQTAAFRPAQKWTLLEQAFEWERLAMTELDACYTVFDTASRVAGSPGAASIVTISDHGRDRLAPRNDGGRGYACGLSRGRRTGRCGTFSSASAFAPAT
jgi:hypothetical protein